MPSAKTAFTIAVVSVLAVGIAMWANRTFGLSKLPVVGKVLPG